MPHSRLSFMSTPSGYSKNQKEKELWQMEEQSSLFDWGYYQQEEGIEELKNCMFYSTFELEASILSANDELSRKDEEILQLKSLIANSIKERDEYQRKCHTLMLEKRLLSKQVNQMQPHASKQQQLQYSCASLSTSGTLSSNVEDENTDLSHSSHPEEEIQHKVLETREEILQTKQLPENGKFLKAVMEAGPLLQTLLVAGPLPQWQHPPPQLSSLEIPPVTISSPRPRVLHQEFSSLLTSPGSGGFNHKKAKINMEDLSIFPPKYYKKLYTNIQSSLIPSSSCVPIID